MSGAGRALDAEDRAGLDPTQSSIIGLILLGQLVIVVLGALAITSEYSTQAIRGSLTAMPRRGILFAAGGVLLFAAVAATVTVLAAFASFVTGQRLLAGVHAGAMLSQPGVLRAILATALFVVLCGLFSYGLGTVIRSTAGTIASRPTEFCCYCRSSPGRCPRPGTTMRSAGCRAASSTPRSPAADRGRSVRACSGRGASWRCSRATRSSR